MFVTSSPPLFIFCVLFTQAVLLFLFLLQFDLICDSLNFLLFCWLWIIKKHSIHLFSLPIYLFILALTIVCTIMLINVWDFSFFLPTILYRIFPPALIFFPPSIDRVCFFSALALSLVCNCSIQWFAFCCLLSLIGSV